MRRARSQAGFTLIEVMFVVVLIAVLAAIAIPSFMSESQRTKATSEVNAMFAQFQVRLEQFRVENNTYPAVAICPAAPAEAGQDVTVACTSGLWAPVRVAPPSAILYCAYRVISGTGVGTTTAVVAGNTFTFAGTGSPNGPWYYVTAICDMDGDATQSGYITSSFDNRIQAFNEGE